MQASLDTLMRLVEQSHTPGAESARVSSHGELKLTKFSEATDDIEAYLTMFERLVTAHHVDTTQWAYLLAPQLTGKAQQAFTAMPSASSGSYAEVKKAILKRYDINEETYRQRFRNATCKEGETYQELAVRLADLLDKWMKDYKADPAKVLQQVAIEQLLSRLPRDIQIYEREHKARSVIKADEMADNYVQAWKPMAGEKAMSTEFKPLPNQMSVLWSEGTLSEGLQEGYS